MRKLTIENEVELLCLEKILKDYPILLSNTGNGIVMAWEGSISEGIRLSLLGKVKKCLEGVK